MASLTSDRPGIAGLSDDHLRRLDAGLITQSELARDLGISKQCVSAALRRRRARATTAPAAEPERATPAPAERPVESRPHQVAASPTEAAPNTAAEEERLAQLASGAWWATADSFIRAIAEAQSHLVRNKGKLGATSLNAYVRAVRESADGLRALGLLPPVGGHQDAEQPAQLVVTVLTQAEEAEIRAQINEQAAGEGYGEEVREERPSTPTAMPHAAPVPLINESLPTPETFASWINGQAYYKGTAWLRQIVTALGGKVAQARDDLVAELLRITGGDPQRLLPLCGGPA